MGKDIFIPSDGVFRRITDGEDTLLRSEFGEMLPYGKLYVSKNLPRRGGKTNSITPYGIPYMSPEIYSDDYSRARLEWQATFIHEHVHVWQYYRGINVPLRLFRTVPMFNYDHNYPYDLEDRPFQSYNLEQQAAIVEDNFLVTKLSTPTNNRNPGATAADYRPLIDNFRSAGAPMLLQATYSTWFGGGHSEWNSNPGTRLNRDGSVIFRS